MRQIERRKIDHIEVALKQDVASAHNHWNDVKLVHCSLPEIDLDEVDTSCVLFGRKLSFPLIITAITGGYPNAIKINRNLAEACAELQIGLGIGSQRAGVQHGDDGSYGVLKDHDIPLRIANLGAPQLIRQRTKAKFDEGAIRTAMEMIDAHLLAIHLNFLQEVVQPEGDTRANGCLDAMRDAAKHYPLIAKETGAGISRDVALRLKGIGMRGLDVSGTGGTSFSAIERHRAQKVGDAHRAALGGTFDDWGIPAPVATVWANVGIPLIASGGIGDGLQVAKGMVLGASCAGAALAVLPEAMESAEKVKEKLRIMHAEFRSAMFLMGAKKVSELAGKRYVLVGETREWLSQLKTEG
jgi:isopentenyl-diphosphate delta-isomerase